MALMRAQPKASVGFHWMMGIAGLLLSAGAAQDIWAHFHGRADLSFFTPWHAILYGMTAMIGFLLGAMALVNVSKGHSWRHSLPPGYMLSLAGVIMFIIGGTADLGWHTLFGIESDNAAFLSPTHLLLLVSGILAGTGPLRAAWLTLSPATTGWLKLGPMVLSATAAMMALSLYTSFASPMVDTFAAKYSTGQHDQRAWLTGLTVAGVEQPDSSGIGNRLTLTNIGIFEQSFGVAEVIVQSVLLMSMILLLVRSWIVPFGAITCLIVSPSIAQALLVDNYRLIVAALAAGLLGDMLVLRLRRSGFRGIRFYAFAAVVPAFYEAAVLSVLGLTAGFDWSVNLIGGVILYAAASGLFLAFLLDWPIRSQAAISA